MSKSVKKQTWQTWLMLAVVFAAVMSLVLLCWNRIRIQTTPHGVNVGVEYGTGDFARYTDSALLQPRDGMKSAGPEGEMFKDEKDAVAGLLLINHINFAVTKIKNANDSIVLEEEYNQLNQNAILLDSIQDQEMIELICDIMDTIVAMRIEERERDFLKEELEQGLSDAAYDAIPNPMNLIASNPISAICNIATAAASSYMNYKKAKANLSRKFKRANWELDKVRMTYLNDLNKSLLMKYWVIVDRYKIPDYHRVVEDDIVHLVERLKDTNKERKYAFLKQSESKYRFLPVYWYHRGLAAYECDELDDAMAAFNCYQSYQNDFCKILRYDKTAASVAMLKLNIMMRSGDKGYTDQEFIEQLGIIEANATNRDWNYFYYEALVYYQRLKDGANAIRLLRRAIDEMEFSRDNNLVDWKEFIQARMDADDVQSGEGKDLLGNDALFSCKTLLTEIETVGLPEGESHARLDELCKAESTAAREKLFCYCSLDYKGAIKALEKDIKGIAFQCDVIDGTQMCINVAMPVSWVIGREGDMALYCRRVDSPSDNVLTNQVTLGTRFLEYKSERKILTFDDSEKVVLRFLPEDGNFAPDRNVIILVIRYNRGSGESFQIAVQSELDAHGKYTHPAWEAFGKWTRGDRVNAVDVESKWSEGAYFQKISYDSPSEPNEDPN